MPSPRLYAVIASLVFGTILQAQVTLNLGSGSGAPGNQVTLNMTLGGGANPAGVQWIMAYPVTALEFVSAADGAAANNASKDTTCTPNLGVVTCIVFGLNANTMANGVVSTLTFRILPGANVPSASIIGSGWAATSALGSPLGASGNNGTITINQPVNQAPTATNQSTSTNEDTAKAITLAGTDPDSNPLTFSIVSGPSKGVLSGSGANRTYTPNANANGADSFVFQVNDGNGGTDNGTVNITVNPVNDAPTAQNQSVSTGENTPKAITLTGSDVDGNTLTFSIVSQPAHGSLTGSGANRTYTPANNYSGPDSFTFQVNDGNGGTDNGTVNITVTDAPNANPTATDGATSTNEDTPKAITLAGSDPNGDTLSFSIVTGPGKGSLTGSGANRTYTPNANASGADSFVFQVNDGKGGTDNGTINITINPLNDAPSTQNQAVSTAENTAKAITLAGSDVDGDSLTFSITGQPSHGSVSGGTGAGRTYTPAQNYTGPDSFTFQVNDGNGGTANGTVTITVTSGPNANPTATNGATSTNEDTPKAITLAGSDADGDSLSFSIVTPPGKGSLTGSGANRTYTPNANATGADSFVFQVNDGHGGSDNGTVSITINPVNDAPTTQNQSVSTAEGTSKAITLVGSDVDGDSLTFLVSQPAHGTVNSGTGPSHTYTPAAGYTGPDSFTYQVQDGKGGTVSGTVTINVTAGQNGAPTANDANVTTSEDTPKAITLSATDPNSDPITYTVMSQPAKGDLSGTAPNLMYTPDSNATGSDSFSFRAADGKGGSDTATVNVTISAVNDSPTAQNQSVSTQKNKAAAIRLAGNDVDGDALSFTVLTQPGHGALSGNAPNLTYTPANGFSGSDGFTFRVADNKGGTGNGTVTINVAAGNTNKPPKAHNQSITTEQNKSKSITLQGSDEDGDTLTFSVLSGPSHGNLTGNAPSVNYTPANNYAGPDAFTFEVNDGKGGKAQGTVDIAVLEDAPLTLESISCNGGTLTGGGNKTCQVFLSGPASNGGANVRISESSKQLAVPNLIRIASKSRSASFKASSDLVTTPESVQLTATMGSASPAAAPVAAASSVATTLTLVPLRPTALSCLPLQIKAGKTLTCEAKVNSSGFSDRVNLNLTSNSPDVNVPDTVPLRPGRSSVSFRAWVDESADQQSATLVAALFGGQASSTVSIITAQSPVIKVDSPQVISVGKKLTFEVEAWDPNDLPLTLSAENLPQGATFDGPTGKFNWTPSESQVGTHQVNFIAKNTANAVAEKLVTIEVITGTMKIFSFTNAASSSGDYPCSPRSLATVWGVGFTDGSSERARTFPLPTSLNDVEVDINGRPARLLYVGPKQINLQCPSLPAGTKLAVTVENTATKQTASWNAATASMKEASPAVFSLDGSGTGQGLVIIANTPKIAMLPNPNMDAEAAQPAEPGDHLVIYANGLGLVDHEVPDGEPAAASPLSQVLATVRVKVGDTLLPVTFAGLAPSMAGVYQVNTILSELVPFGPEVPLSLEVQLPDGTVLQSNVVTIAIQDGAPRFAE
jgi:uncharacterized protein (TIGR03437 family)